MFNFVNICLEILFKHLFSVTLLLKTSFSTSHCFTINGNFSIKLRCCDSSYARFRFFAWKLLQTLNYILWSSFQEIHLFIGFCLLSLNNLLFCAFRSLCRIIIRHYLNKKTVVYLIYIDIKLDLFASFQIIFASNCTMVVIIHILFHTVKQISPFSKKSKI